MDFIDFYNSKYPRILIYFIFFIYGCISVFIVFKDKKNIFKASVILFFLMIFSVLGIFYILDSYLYYKLNQFDLNGDGVFSGLENTAEQEMYMQLFIRDVGRNFGLIIGLFFSFFYSLFFYFSLKIFLWIKKVTCRKN